MDAIIRAIQSKVAADPTLTDDVTGGFHLLRTPTPNAMPSVVAIPAPSEQPEYTTDQPYVERVNVQISVFAATAKAACKIGRTWRRAFNRKPLALDEGRALLTELVSQNLLYEPADGEDGLAAYQYVLEFSILQQQAIA